jgi:drug/metabolite transporter (DMT)-like permease
MTVNRFLAAATVSQKGRHLTAMAAMALAAFFWAAIEHLGGLVPKGYSPVQTVWSRYLVHLLFMLIAFGPREGRTLVQTRCLASQVSRALLMVGMPACFIWGIALLPVQIVWLLSWSSVVMLMVLGWVLLGERVSPSLWIATGIGWIGIWIMSGEGLPPLSWRYLVPLSMGFCFALYIVMTRRMHGESTHAKLFHTALWVFLVLSLGAPFQWKMPSLKVLADYVGIGLLGYISLYFLDKSIELAPVSLSSPLIYTEPVWSCIQKFIISGKLPGNLAVAGALIILGTSVFIVLAVWSGRVRLDYTN